MDVSYHNNIIFSRFMIFSCPVDTKVFEQFPAEDTSDYHARSTYFQQENLGRHARSGN